MPDFLIVIVGVLFMIFGAALTLGAIAERIFSGVLITIPVFLIGIFLWGWLLYASHLPWEIKDIQVVNPQLVEYPNGKNNYSIAFLRNGKSELKTLDFVPANGKMIKVTAYNTERLYMGVKFTGDFHYELEVVDKE